MSASEQPALDNSAARVAQPHIYQEHEQKSIPPQSYRWIGFAIRACPWMIFVLLFILLTTLFLHWDAIVGGRRFQTTNNAYVYYDNVFLEAKVSGYVKKVDFSDFQDLEAGHVLVTLVDDDYRLAVKQAEAKRHFAQAALKKLELEEDLQKACVEQTKATLEHATAKVDHLEREFGRVSTLYQQHVVSDSEADTVETDLKTAKADLAESRASLNVQQQKLRLVDGDRELRKAELEEAEAAYSQAMINLSYTVFKAPAHCTTGACKIREGELVKVGTVIATLTPYQAPYIIANYKETQLANIHVGESVSLNIDTFPGHEFKGTVAGISPATGATYSLVPVDRSSGNFTKVVQRIPVRIELVPNQPMLDRLRAGMSATTAIDTRPRENNGTSRNNYQVAKSRG